MTKFDPYSAQLESYPSESVVFEREKASITSYEEGWDEWDGPIWPWKQDNEKVKFREVTSGTLGLKS